jgi:hypothetical protein
MGDDDESHPGIDRNGPEKILEGAKAARGRANTDQWKWRIGDHLKNVSKKWRRAFLGLSSRAATNGAMTDYLIVNTS